MKKLYLLFLFTVIFTFCFQSAQAEYTITPQTIQQHIEILAHDSLEGRQVGEPGELKAAEYIRSVFKSAGLVSVGIENYFQYYDFLKDIKITNNNTLTIGGVSLILYEDYIPLKQSSSTAFDFSKLVDVNYGIKVSDDSGSYNDYANKNVEGAIVFIKRFSPEADSNSQIELDNYAFLAGKISTAIKQKAGGIIFYTPEGYDDTMKDLGVKNIHTKEIPIFFFKQSGMAKLLASTTNPHKISGVTELVRVHDTAQNVIGFIQGESDTTVIIGAHYDHLGWGGPTSLYHGDPAIHNGADDNASGVAALLEMARKYSQPDNKLHYSLLFIAFSGEEAGLLGANNFAKKMTIDSSKVRMMLNMDMIGRLKDQENGLAILGVGTTKEFANFFDSLNYKDIKLTLKQSGTGPSDHTVFYNRKIPVLHLFTGAHSDYHKPTDDIKKIDFEGIVKVTSLVDKILEHFDKLDQPLLFRQTKDSSAGKHRKKYSVTLGVMPDYTAEVKGLKIDGVIEDRPAAMAGMLKGDIVVQLGKVVINDIYDYMNALSKLKKGDTVTAIINRKDKRIELSVTF